MRIGESVLRADGPAKVRGDFIYSSDLHVDEMLWGATVRSPHPYARILSIDVSEARSMPGVHAVLTHEDVPGSKLYGLEIQDQPVLAFDVVRYWGEAVALVAADHPEQARRAADKVRVEYQVLTPITNAEQALSEDAPKLHPDGNVTRHVRIRHGDPSARADVVVRGEYEIGMQDQAPLGPESGLAVPDAEGGVDLYIATQWLHVDQHQLANILALPPEKVRLTMAGIGGAFGAREDLSMQAHACLLALKTGRPVKISYSRPESFVGHVHRHPGRLSYEHGANTDGMLVYVRARILLDGGAYASSSTAVIDNASCFAVGPYRCPNATIDGIVAYSNNPPCGAMRGFGSVQNCYAHEAQMDKLAAALGMDPVELRIRNGMETGREMIPGQKIDGPVPVAELLSRVSSRPLPANVSRPLPVYGEGKGGAVGPADLTAMPGGVSNTTHGEGVKRGIGYAVGFKNIGYSEGFDDHSTARVRLSVIDGKARGEGHTAAAEVGQGTVMVQAQIAGSELGVNDIVVLNADTRVGSAGSSSASRQTYITGGAVKSASEAVCKRVLELAQSELHPASELRIENDAVVGPDGKQIVPLATLLGDAVIEEIQVKDGVIRNPSFTDYLLPTILDMPPLRMDILELGDPNSPYGLKGVGEPPTISSGPAIVAAIRAATGRDVTRVPVRPHDLTL